MQEGGKGIFERDDASPYGELVSPIRFIGVLGNECVLFLPTQFLDGCFSGKGGSFTGTLFQVYHAHRQSTAGVFAAFSSIVGV